jgi:SAM-dependent methyltransferase
MTDAAIYGRDFAGVYDRIFPSGSDIDQTVSRLADLHVGGGLSALEFGVGTGRIALPLAEHVGDVVGVDASPDMLAVLTAALQQRARPVTAVLADIRDYDDGRTYGLVYCVCGTLSMLMDPDDQRRVICNAARLLAPEAALVIETHNPAAVRAMHAGRPRDSFFMPYPGKDTGLLSYSTIDEANSFWHLAHIWFEPGDIRVLQEFSRFITPDDLDAHAERAGLHLTERYSDWDGSSFSGDEPMYISVFRAMSSDRAAAPAGLAGA